MITCIRQVRNAKGLTLLDVAKRCDPPTTAQTIGRLETGTRTVSVGWLNRIAGALGVETADLVRLPDKAELPVAALLGSDGAHAPGKESSATAPQPGPGWVAIRVEQSVGDYRAGDTIWCERIERDGFGRALNRDVLVPRPGGRLAFGRLIGLEGSKLLLLPLASGGRQTVIADAPWLAAARRVVREL
ncbi:helix-turn-helix domain-containing protein [Sphingomonas crusticola]|uniref:helix-turn-helix domain-containing protein n=1 Tax=Sphingomonas crusticola TaxID=1697973 RepID=UPI000E272039|nr:helix-turn-helix transcriptional regulator [Sphingomonas crusticola]